MHNAYSGIVLWYMDSKSDWVSTVFLMNKEFRVLQFNSLVSGCFRGFSEKKTPKCTWLCVGISLVWYGLQTL